MDHRHSVLVTGATGFAGHHLVERLRHKSRVIGLTTRAIVPDDGSSVIYRTGNVVDPDFIIAIISEYRPTSIVHLAAKTHNWFDNTRLTFEINVTGTLNLYEAVLRLKQTEPDYNPKILYVSSSEAYGRTTEPSSISEHSPLWPANHYSASKAAADLISYDYSQSQKLRIVIARPFTHTGPNQPVHAFASSIASQIAKIEAIGSGKLFVGNLEAIRDYLDVRDVVRAYELLLEVEMSPGEVFNVCSGSGVMVKDILQTLIGMSSAKISVERDFRRIRPNETPVFVGNNEKLRRLTGWTPEVNLTNSLANLLQYWRDFYGTNSQH